VRWFGGDGAKLVGWEVARVAFDLRIRYGRVSCRKCIKWMVERVTGLSQCRRYKGDAMAIASV